VVAGGILSWNVAIPVYSTFLLDGNAEVGARIAGASADAAAGAIWSTQIRYLGVGAMLIGGLWTLVSLRKSILSGIRSGLAATRAGAERVVAHTEQDLPMKPVLIAVVIFALPLLVLYQAIVADFTVSVPMTVIMIVAGFLFCSVSAYMAGLIGSSNNPVSGITIATIIFASLVLIALMGRGAPLGPIAAIMIGAVVCCAAAVAGDNLQDLKAGRIVGATPWRQQVMLAIGAVSCAFVMAPVLNLLEKAYGIGVPSAAHPNPLLAPQATLMASVSKGMFGGALPWGMVWTGVGIGAAIIILDETLKARGARFRTPVLAASFGIYLPLEFTVPIFLGGLIAYFVERKRDVGRDPDALERLHRRGVLFAAGLITGEALMGIVIAIPIVASGRADVLALPERMQPGTSGQWLGLAMLAGIAALLYRAARSRGPAQDDP
jgi:putative OPT family oligopeptide transporter